MKVSAESLKKINLSRAAFLVSQAEAKASYAVFEVEFTRAMTVVGAEPDGNIVCMICGEIRPNALAKEPCICQKPAQEEAAPVALPKPVLVPKAAE